MFRVENNNIYLTRGDTAEFKPIIENYEVQEGDKVVFAAKRNHLATAADIRIEVDAGASIEFAHSTTSSLPLGTYLYEIKLTTVDGDISTFAIGRFILEGDIDNENN